MMEKDDVGFVPTMGALHEGHRSLVRTAATECETVVASIFVNPTQFNDPRDLDAYPRTLEADLGVLEASGCHVVFLPSAEEMYGYGSARVMAGSVAALWEGEHRPGHFDGVATIVAKLFGAVGPCTAFFGLKDLQQCAVVRDMVASLLLPVGLRLVPTVREPSGLAMSSRNVRLTEDGRAKAACMYQTLLSSVRRIQDGEQAGSVLAQGSESLRAQGFEVEYLAMVDPVTMEPRKTADPTSHIIVAAKIEGIRLIDNLPVSAS
ncbi:MAG: pantoate--beta-alanine ligase [Fimbriimonadaceae bacterium]